MTVSRKAPKSSRQKPLPDAGARRLLCGLANLREDRIPDFRRRWDHLYRNVANEELLQRRDELRVAWSPTLRKDDPLLDELPNQEIRINPRANAFAPLRRAEYTGLPPLERMLMVRPGEPKEKLICEYWLSEAKEPWLVEWEPKRRIRSNPRSLPAVLALTYLQNADYFGYCRNPECKTRYFFSRRRDQLYCSPACALPSKRAAKLEWWRKNYGKQVFKRGGKRP